MVLDGVAHAEPYATEWRISASVFTFLATGLEDGRDRSIRDAQNRTQPELGFALADPALAWMKIVSHFSCPKGESVFPSWDRRGGRARQENAAKRPYERRGRGGQFGVNVPECISEVFSRTDHPVCAAAEAVFFLLAQPPLLFHEGNPLLHNPLLAHLFIVGHVLPPGRSKTHMKSLTC